MQDITSNEASPFFFINHSDNFIPIDCIRGNKKRRQQCSKYSHVDNSITETFLSPSLGIARGFNILIFHR